MEQKIFERLVTDLKNLPKTDAPKDLEQRLSQRIAEYERDKLRPSKKRIPAFEFFKNPILAPAFSIVFVFLLLLFSVHSNKGDEKFVSSVPKAEPKLTEDNMMKDIPIASKINLPKRKDIVVARARMRLPLELGPGVSLDNPTGRDDFGTGGIETTVSFPFPNGPVQIRIPPPGYSTFSKQVEMNVDPRMLRDSILRLNFRNR